MDFISNIDDKMRILGLDLLKNIVKIITEEIFLKYYELFCQIFKVFFIDSSNEIRIESLNQYKILICEKIS